jgi:hypothetical protein
MPKPPPKNPLEIKEIEYYDALSEPDFAALPMETMYKVGEKYIAEGKTPRVVQWGQYAPERPKLYDLQARAAVDFKFFQGHMVRCAHPRCDRARHVHLALSPPPAPSRHLLTTAAAVPSADRAALQPREAHRGAEDVCPVPRDDAQDRSREGQVRNGLCACTAMHALVHGPHGLIVLRSIRVVG